MAYFTFWVNNYFNFFVRLIIRQSYKQDKYLNAYEILTASVLLAWMHCDWLFTGCIKAVACDLDIT